MISLVLLSRIMNHGNTDMTIEMPAATMPLMLLYSGETEYNDMQPYVEDMDILRMNEHITPLDESRSLRFRIKLYGSSVNRLSFQLRSLKDNRLIEENQIFDYAKTDDSVNGNLSLHDLIKKDTAYSLCFLLECGDGRLLRYYTRVILMPGSQYLEKLAFARYFHEISYDKARAKSELPTYLESNSRGDNSSFSYVDIHSSIEQVSWGSLSPVQLGRTRMRIRDIDNDSAQIALNYLIQLEEGERQQYCFVEEYFVLRIGRERVYLLSYERRMTELFDEDRAVIAGNKIQLGMTGNNVIMKESSDGHILAFSSCGRLFTYDSNSNRLSYVFGYYDEDMEDERVTSRNNEIIIFNVEETGNVRFASWGYFPCGGHEGCTGIVVYYYDSSLNIVEEELYIPFEGDYEQLAANVNRLCYVGERGMYLIKDDDIYELGLNNHSVELLAQDIPLSGMVASESREMLAWGNGENLYGSDTLFIRNLQRGSSGSILSEAGDKLLPITFFGNDLVYGLAREEDITTDASGHTVFPMYSINIRSQSGQTLKEYSQENVYITAVEQNGDMINLSRVRKTENGLVSIADDQIMNNNSNSSTRNVMESVVTEHYETIYQLVLRSDINTDSLQIMRPRLVLFEGERRLRLSTAGSQPLLWQHMVNGRTGNAYTECYDAVNAAYTEGGSVQMADGSIVYRRMTLPTKNQIMAISGTVDGVEAGADNMQLTAACIDTWLSYLGTETHSYARLYKGQSPAELVAELMPGAQVLDLSGISLDAALYYPGNEMPLLVQLADDSAMLLIGYNELNVVVMDPSSPEQVYKLGKNDATALFEAGGNRFLACIINED